MNEQDKELIERLAKDFQESAISIDNEAKNYIQDSFSKNTNALYQLTQAVLVQKNAIDQLKKQVDGLNQDRNEPKKSFLSNLFRNDTQSRQNQSYQPQGSSQGPNHRFGQGSFLSSALTTAAGVAGGMFLYEGINHLFSGNQSSAASSDSFLSNSTDLDQGFGGDDNFLNQESSSDFSDMTDFDDW
jgi:hypothetical protein